MLKLIDKLFKSDLVYKPTFFDKLISFIIVVVLWVVSITLYYYSLPIDTKSASEYFIYDKAELGFNESSREFIGYINTSYSISKEQPQIVIYTDDNRVLASEVDKRANDIFNEIGIGSAEYNSGVLIYVNINPDTKVRIEVGYGLEDVINDAKAGMIIDENVKNINNEKPLKYFNREELALLSLNIFKDINSIIKEKYDINFPKGFNTSLVYHYENKDKHILILIIISILLYFRCLKYRHTYVMVFMPFVTIVTIAYALNEVLYLISDITLLVGFSVSSPASHAVILIIAFLMLPFIFNILLYTTNTDDALANKRKNKQDNQQNKQNNQQDKQNNQQDKQNNQQDKHNNSDNQKDINVINNGNALMPNAKILLKELFIPTKNKSYYGNLPHRFLLNYVVIFLLVYMFMFYMIDKYGYTGPVVLFIVIILSISIFLFIKIKSYRIALTYASYVSTIIAYALDFNIVYDDFIHISAAFMFIFNIMIGFGPLKGGGSSSSRGGFTLGRRGGSFRSSGRSGGFSGRRGGSFRGGGRSGGGGARR